MNKVFVFGIVLVGLFVSTAAADGFGSAFGTLATARALGQGKANFAAGVGIADATTVIGVLEYGLSRYTDGRIKFALYDRYDDVKATVGADIKWQLWDISEGRREAFDLAFGGFFEYLDVQQYAAFQFGTFALGSYPFQLNSGGTLSPYARLNVRLESISWDSPDAGQDDSDTDIRFGLNGGVAWQATSVIGLFGEFQIDGNDGIFLGINFNIQ